MDFISFIRAWVQHTAGCPGNLSHDDFSAIMVNPPFLLFYFLHSKIIISTYLKSLLTKSSVTPIFVDFFCRFFARNFRRIQSLDSEDSESWKSSCMAWTIFVINDAAQEGNDAPGIRPRTQPMDFSKNPWGFAENFGKVCTQNMLCSDMFMVFVYDDNDVLCMMTMMTCGWNRVTPWYTLFADKTICFPSPGYCNLKGPQLILDIYASSVRGMPITDFAKTKPAWAY